MRILDEREGVVIPWLGHGECRGVMEPGSQRVIG